MIDTRERKKNLQFLIIQVSKMMFKSLIESEVTKTIHLLTLKKNRVI